MSLKNRGAAEAEWRRLQGVFPNLLGDKSLLLQSAEVAGVGTVYRLRAGPFASKAKAAKFSPSWLDREVGNVTYS